MHENLPITRHIAKRIYKKKIKEGMWVYVHISCFSSASAADSTSIQLTNARSCNTNDDRFTGEKKPHRCALDFDHGFVKAAIKEDKEQRGKWLLFIFIVIIIIIAASSLSNLKK